MGNFAQAIITFGHLFKLRPQVSIRQNTLKLNSASFLYAISFILWKYTLQVCEDLVLSAIVFLTG